MRSVSEKEVLAFMRETFPPEYDFREADYSARQSEDGSWTLRIEQMYEYVPMGAEQLFKLCEFFDTMNINDSRYHIGGCETCDYGSSYEITLHVHEGKPFPREQAA